MSPNLKGQEKTCLVPIPMDKKKKKKNSNQVVSI